MKKKRLRCAARSLLLGTLTLLPLTFVEGQYVRITPPPPVAERPYQAPGCGYVWVPGYQRWNGQRYQWTSGRWVRPPRPSATWMPGRWDHSGDGWRWVSGRWRG